MAESTRNKFEQMCSGQAPWLGSDCGGYISADGAEAGPFSIDDVSRFISAGSTGDDWDGYGVGVIRLKDGRYVAWESAWGPTGSGFSCDAYGGDATLTFAKTYKIAVRMGISADNRELLQRVTLKT